MTIYRNFPKQSKPRGKPSIFTRCINNPLFSTFAVGIGFFLSCFFSITIHSFFLLPTSILAISLIYSIHKHKKEIQHETALLINLIINAFLGSKWAWWSSISRHLVLGALPLKNKKHVQQLIEKERIGAVLSMVEPFEVELPGLFHRAATPEDWISRGVVYKQIPVVDRTAPAPDKIRAALDFIKEQIKQGRRVYLHCKAGAGRSAVIAMSYLLRYGGIDSPEEAIKFLQERRNQVFFLDSQRKDAIHAAHFNFQG